MSGGATSPRRPLAVAAVVLAVALALAGGIALGALVLGGSTPSDDSVDAGFARDMRDHHAQAVEMSFLVREDSDDAAVDQLALDIMLTQQQQVGQMYAWLDDWDLPQAGAGARMQWMDGMEGMDGTEGMDGMDMAGGMPGMATNAEMQQLQAARGERAARIYLQLMIPHHEAGVDMAAYAVEHADTDQVVRLAESIEAAQQSELTVLRDLLEERGGPVPLAS